MQAISGLEGPMRREKTSKTSAERTACAGLTPSSEKYRGTWKIFANKSLHEIDGFLVEQQQRSRLVRQVRTVAMKEKLSDHYPKGMW